MKQMSFDRKLKSDNQSGIKIIRIAAFCFAIISWIATAQGLYEYVFVDQYVQAYIVSFAIQSILFVFNLKLPFYFRQIGIKNFNLKAKKYSSEEVSGTEKSKYKFSFLQFIIAIFYMITLLSSSFFSFVYITNLVYNDTRYIDSTVVLDHIFRTYLNDTEQYIEEYSKISRIIISEELAELQKLIPEQETTSFDTSKAILIDALEEAKLNYDNMEEEVINAQNNLEMTKSILMTPMSERWRSPDDYKKEKEDYDAALENLNATEKKEILLKKNWK